MTIAIFKRPDGIKRIAAAVLAAATLISVAACGSGNSASASKESLNTTKGKTTTINVGVCRTIWRHGRQGYRATAER